MPVGAGNPLPKPETVTESVTDPPRVTVDADSTVKMLDAAGLTMKGSSVAPLVTAK